MGRDVQGQVAGGHAFQFGDVVDVTVDLHGEAGGIGGGLDDGQFNGGGVAACGDCSAQEPAVAVTDEFG